MRPTKLAKTEDPVSEAVDSTTPDITMADAKSIQTTEVRSSEHPQQPTIITNAEHPAIVAPIITTTVSASEAEALPPTNVVSVPTEEEDVPMAEATAVEEFTTSVTEEAKAEPKITIIENTTQSAVKELVAEIPEEPKAVVVVEPKSPASEESKEDVSVAKEETIGSTEQIKKTDSDAGDEPKIVDIDVDSMDVDMVDVASSLNGNGADAVELVEALKVEKKIAAIEKVQIVDAVQAVEPLKEVVEQEAVKSEEVSEEMQDAEKAIVSKECDEEKKTVVAEGLPVELIEGKESDLGVNTESNQTVEEAVVKTVPTEIREVDVTKTTTETLSTQNKHSESVVSLIETDEAINGIVTPISADSQTVPCDPNITNEETETTAEVTIPIVVEQSGTASVSDSNNTSPSILSTSSETSELTETKLSESTIGKEKVSRVEITIEQVEKLPGQTTQTTTTHIVKEIIIKEQHVSPTKSVEIAAATKETNEVTTEQLNGQTNGNADEHIVKTNGKELAIDVEAEKNGDDSDKENEVSTTNGSGATANAESEHLADVVLKKCTAVPTAAPIETIPDVTA